jgi:putative nucleotidyltransferase with HDIG domain
MGYFSFVMLFVIGTGDIIQIASKRFEESIYSLFPDKDGDSIMRLLASRDPKVVDSIRIFEKVASGITSIENIRFYYNDKGTWFKFFEGLDGYFYSEAIKDVPLKNKLNKSLARKKTLSGEFFFGASDVVNVMDNLTRSSDDRMYILSYDVLRPSIISFIQKRPYENLGFFVILVFLSFIIGMLFSRGITRPLEQLSSEANAMAEGDLERIFHTKGKDEIGRLAGTLNYMAQKIRESMKEREELMLGILTALTRSIDAKSRWTAGHSERVTKYAEMIGRKLKFSDEDLRNLVISALLHDIGKLAVPEEILDKPGRLTDEEFDVVKTHPRVGANIVEEIPTYHDVILPGILHHHERWDGKGYPKGLEGEEIPLFARIITVADVFDAITADRPYRKAMSEEEVRVFVKENIGKMFDPEITELFISVIMDIISKEKKTS